MLERIKRFFTSVSVLTYVDDLLILSGFAVVSILCFIGLIISIVSTVFLSDGSPLEALLYLLFLDLVMMFIIVLVANIKIKLFKKKLIENDSLFLSVFMNIYDLIESRYNRLMRLNKKLYDSKIVLKVNNKNVIKDASLYEVFSKYEKLLEEVKKSRKRIDLLYNKVINSEYSIKEKFNMLIELENYYQKLYDVLCMLRRFLDCEELNVEEEKESENRELCSA